MNHVVELFRLHGALILFLVVWLENMGAPLPSFPFLLAAGAMAVSGDIALPLAFGVATTAALLADTLWYYLGKVAGRRILRQLCLISLNPESCVSKTESTFSRYGLRSLMVAKFVPGLNTIVPPLCGLLRIPVLKFLVFDFLGCLFWVFPLILTGYIFSRQLEALFAWVKRFGNAAFLILLAAAVAFLALKIYERRKFYRHIRAVRIAPDELHEKMKSGEAITVVDLRSPLAFEADLFSIPGSVRIEPHEFQVRMAEFSREKELILYCT